MFQWSGKRSSKTATTISGSIRPPVIARKDHIDSYLLDPNLKKSTRKVSADDSTFDTVFSTVTKVTLILRVHLPYGKDSYPAMSLAGAIGTHAWLDHRMCITGYPPVRDQAAWVDSGLKLGAAVKAVVEHLQLHPPSNIRISDPGLRGIQPADGPCAEAPTSSAVGSDQPAPPPPQYQDTRIPDIDLPAIPRHFDELDNMTLAELEVLQSDELSFLAFCNRLEVTSTHRTIATSVLGDNAATAEKHLEQESKVKELQTEISESTSKLKEAVREFQSFEKEQDVICAPPDYSKVKSDLEELKNTAFRESEELADKWTEDGGDVEMFLKEFISTRTRHHELAGKLELLNMHKPV